MYRWWYLRGLGVVYFIAFAQLLPQIQGLIGTHGILPASQFLSKVAEQVGLAKGFQLLPSVFWFVNASDANLVIVTIGGVIASLLVACGYLAAPALIVCFGLYLSFVSIGQDFLSFQWDSLLLEAGFLAIFMAPWTPVDRPKDVRMQTPRAVIFIWLTRLLLFKLMFLSGIVKIASQDPAWLSASALKYHYETQPLPTPLAWYAHQLPAAFQSGCTIIMFVIELIIPFFMWGKLRARKFAAAATVALQTLILLTGNYTFFNLLTIILCLVLLDDSALPRGRGIPILGAAAGIGMLLAEFCVLDIGMTAVHPPAAADIASAIEPFRICNTYGLFAVMTKVRDEITIEGSDDGVTWKPYTFIWKPGPLDRPPLVVAPYQPRLDWQMWFASLGSVARNQWFVMLCKNILKGNPTVLALLQTNPFPDRPPTYLRATIAAYHFTNWKEFNETKNWWKADEPHIYLQAVSLSGS